MQHWQCMCERMRTLCKCVYECVQMAKGGNDGGKDGEGVLVVNLTSPVLPNCSSRSQADGSPKAATAKTGICQFSYNTSLALE